MKSAANEKLLFVYNANSGMRNALLDSAHKIFSPNTYHCSLCGITHGAFSEKRIWSAFRENSGIAMDFVHKAEFAAIYRSQFGYKFPFPIVLLETDQGLDVLIGTETLNAMPDAAALIETIKTRM